MTWDQYWYGDVWMVGVFREADKLRMERENWRAWIQGAYFYDALGAVSPILHAFPKKGTKAQDYLKKPYALFKKEQEEDSQEEKDRLKAELYMRQMVRAGKNWGKRGGTDGR